MVASLKKSLQKEKRQCTATIMNQPPAESQHISSHPQEEKVLRSAHPHAGARSATRTLGFIANTSVARLYIPQRKQTDTSTSTQGCGVRVEGGRKVLEKVQTGILQAQKFLQTADPRQYPHILCIVYTVDLPKPRQALLVMATWASKKCDSFFAASNITGDTLGAVDLLHQCDGSYGNMWQKVNIQAEKELS
jgi:hypothetical protein